MKTVKVTSKGQVTLPSELRNKLNIEEGTYLDASILQKWNFTKTGQGWKPVGAGVLPKVWQ